MTCCFQSFCTRIVDNCLEEQSLGTRMILQSRSIDRKIISSLILCWLSHCRDGMQMEIVISWAQWFRQSSVTYPYHWSHLDNPRNPSGVGNPNVVWQLTTEILISIDMFDLAFISLLAFIGQFHVCVASCMNHVNLGFEIPLEMTNDAKAWIVFSVLLASILS